MNEIEEQLKQTLSVFSELKLIILFGSFAANKQKPNSDIDVGVAADEVLTSERKMQMIETIALSFHRSVDLIDLQLKQEPVLSQVITKGKLVFCSDRKLYAELIKTVMFDEADFLPLRARILKERREKWLGN